MIEGCAGCRVVACLVACMRRRTHSSRGQSGPARRSDYGKRRSRKVLWDGDELRHALPRGSLPGKVQVESVLQYPLREMPHTEQRVLHGLAEETPAQEVVIQRVAHVVNEVRALGTMEEIQVMSPAGEEKLPLQFGQLKKFCAFALLHPRVFQRHKSCRHYAPLRILESVEKVKRLAGIEWRFARQSQDPSTK